MSVDLLQRARDVRLMIFDVDGVLTDGSMFYGPEGEALKRFHVHDGMGIRLLEEAGIATAILSARDAAIVRARAKDLRMAHVLQGRSDKLEALEQLLQLTGLTASQCGFIGDDIIDLPVLTRVGLACAVPNAMAEIKKHVHYVTSAGGGNGAVREVADLILQAQDKLAPVMAHYLR